MANTIEKGKIMQLHGLSATQWNGCIVDVGKFDENTTRYSCEVIVGKHRDRKLAVKMSNLTDVPQPAASAITVAIFKFSVLSCTFEAIKDQNSVSELAKNKAMDTILLEAKELLKTVPNCAVLWRLIQQVCKFFLYIFTKMFLMLI